MWRRLVLIIEPVGALAAGPLPMAPTVPPRRDGDDSSRNVRDIIRKLLWSRVNTRLYAVSNTFALEHQKSIVGKELSTLTNHLDPIDPDLTIDMPLNRLSIYRYDAPGSIRAISIDDDFLALGSYTYLKKRRRASSETVDIRGGELPMVIFHKTHAGFPVLKGMLKRLLNNWPFCFWPTF
jgi:hypothetical protein